MKKLVVFTFCLQLASALDRPRGVAVNAAQFYVQNSDGKFTCLHGATSIPFSQVNDDYCDCFDGSDEPGTSACDSGTFTCTNLGFVSTPILSSRVNDFICDCCDGSDEYNSGKRCKNTCDEERNKQMAKYKTLNEGFQVRKVLLESAKKALDETKKRVEEIESNLQSNIKIKDDLQELKEVKEAPEKEAKDRHQAAYDALKKERDELEENSRREEAFRALDANESGGVELDELLHCASIDGSNQCGVSEDEIKEWYPIDKSTLTLDEFTQLVWEHLKPFYKKSSEGTVEPNGTALEEDEHHDQFDEEEDYQDEENDDDTDTGVSVKEKRRLGRLRANRERERKSGRADVPDDMPPYDDETLKLIDEANAARRLFTDQETVVKELEEERNKLKETIELDMGAELEFYHLKGQCFDIDEKEYTYSFCPFNKGAQKATKGGSETSLGRWGEWSGKPNKYSQMKLTQGQRCWNGPDRSLTVSMFCGPVDKVISTSEPSMCEYVMDFTTPALCTEYYDLSGGGGAPSHLEL